MHANCLRNTSTNNCTHVSRQLIPKYACVYTMACMFVCKMRMFLHNCLQNVHVSTQLYACFYTIVCKTRMCGHVRRVYKYFGYLYGALVNILAACFHRIDCKNTQICMHPHNCLHYTHLLALYTIAFIIVCMNASSQLHNWLHKRQYKCIYTIACVMTSVCMYLHKSYDDICVYVTGLYKCIYITACMMRSTCM